MSTPSDAAANIINGLANFNTPRNSNANSSNTLTRLSSLSRRADCSSSTETNVKHSFDNCLCANNRTNKQCFCSFSGRCIAVQDNSQCLSDIPFVSHTFVNTCCVRHVMFHADFVNTVDWLVTTSQSLSQLSTWASKVVAWQMKFWQLSHLKLRTLLRRPNQ